MVVDNVYKLPAMKGKLVTTFNNVEVDRTDKDFDQYLGASPVLDKYIRTYLVQFERLPQEKLKFVMRELDELRSLGFLMFCEWYQLRQYFQAHAKIVDFPTYEEGETLGKG